MVSKESARQSNEESRTYGEETDNEEAEKIHEIQESEHENT